MYANPEYDYPGEDRERYSFIAAARDVGVLPSMMEGSPIRSSNTYDGLQLRD